jgi:Ala-tRNA(Pro) deacylase
MCRGTKIESGAKAILMKVKVKDESSYYLFVMSASKKLDSKKVRKLLNAKSQSFATEDEVKAVTGCLPGAVPPFGSVFGVKTYMDSGFQAIESIDFNAGLRTDSIKMSRKDYELAESPVVHDITTDV